MAAAATDLTTLANVKAYLKIPTATTTNDALIQTLITGVSLRIQKICGRMFNQDTYTERVNTFTRMARAQVKNKPIVQVNSVRWGYGNCILLSYSGSAVLATVQATPTAVLVRTQASGGAVVQTSLTFATYTTTAALATALGAISGFTATAYVDVPSTYIYPTGGMNLKSGGSIYSQSLAYPNVDNFTYTVDYEFGSIAFQPLSSMDAFFGQSNSAMTQISFPSGYQSLLIEYVGGYATIPGDIDLLAQDLTAAAYYMTEKNPSLVSEALGDYNYTMLDPIMRENMILARMAPYIKIPLAGGLA